MLFKNITILDENLDIRENMYVGVKTDKIAYIGTEEPREDYGEVYNGEGKLLMSSFVNAHAHSPMGLLRGYGENLSLQDWLFKKVFPFEDQLDSNAVYWSTLLSMAESIKFGITSSSDMYYFCPDMAKAYIESGCKGNIARSLSAFVEEDYLTSVRGREAKQFYEEYHGCADGRILVDMSLHAEYTTLPGISRQLAEYTKSINAIMHVHVSETKSEHEDCIERYGKTPVAYLDSLGIFDTPTIAAHCVWVTDEDIEILKKRDVTVAVNPISNIKLASGICNTPKLIQNGIKVAIGTDSVASNNSLNFLEEMKMFALAPKLFLNDPTVISPKETIFAATRAGALAQGRLDCGLIKEGYKADLIVMDINTVNMKPVHNLLNNIVYAASSGDIKMTMCDGKVLYQNGEFKTLDVEKIMYEAQRATDNILRKLSVAGGIDG